jgi:hypothetical protein
MQPQTLSKRQKRPLRRAMFAAAIALVAMVSPALIASPALAAGLPADQVTKLYDAYPYVPIPAGSFFPANTDFKTGLEAPVLLSANPDGTGSIFMYDAIEVDVDGVNIYKHSFRTSCTAPAVPIPPIDLLPYLHSTATEHLTVRMVDNCGYVGSTPLYLVVGPSVSGSQPPYAPPAPPARIGAWGDSFVSGEGAPDPALGYLLGTDQADNKCHRSAKSYAALIGAQLKMGLDFHACSGAVVQDFYAPFSSYHNGQNPGEVAQLDTVSSQDTIGFLGIGGNNMGFAEIMTYCATRVAYQPSCERTYGASVAQKLANMSTSPIIEQLYRDVLARMAPGAKLYVVGYPRIFPVTPPASCLTGIQLPTAPTFVRSDMAWINNQITNLNTINMKAVGKVLGAKFIDVTDAFAGHELCNGKNPEWLHRGSVLPAEKPESFHPNYAGHAAESTWILARMS